MVKHYDRIIKCFWWIADDTLVTTMATAKVYLLPIIIRTTVTVDRIIYYIEDPVAGNARVGIYNDNGDTPVGGSLIVESASVAKSATYANEEVTIASTKLTPGLYWIAIQSDEPTTDIIRCAVSDWWTSTLDPKNYDRAGGYGAFTDPCPAVNNHSHGVCCALRVASAP